jgi:hypothetical protein
VREALHELVAPAGELEEVEHLADAIVDAGAVDAVQAAVESQELRRREFLVDEGSIRDEPERRLRRLGFDIQIVIVDDDAAGGRRSA